MMGAMTSAHLVVELKKHIRGCTSNLQGAWGWRRQLIAQQTGMIGWNKQMVFSHDTLSLNHFQWLSVVDQWVQGHLSMALKIPTLGLSLFPDFISYQSCTEAHLFTWAICFAQILPLTFGLSFCFSIHLNCSVVHLFPKTLFRPVGPTEKVILFMK